MNVVRNQSIIEMTSLFVSRETDIIWKLMIVYLFRLIDETRQGNMDDKDDTSSKQATYLTIRSQRM